MLTEAEKNFAVKAVRRKKIYLVLSIASVIAGLSLAVFYSWESSVQPEFEMGTHFAIVILILLNARQNLRQYRYAKILELVIVNK